MVHDLKIWNKRGETEEVWGLGLMISYGSGIDKFGIRHVK